LNFLLNQAFVALGATKFSLFAARVLEGDG
jgi:hypothetical protein